MQVRSPVDCQGTISGLSVGAQGQGDSLGGKIYYSAAIMWEDLLPGSR